jgi:hypothetical protein
MARDFIKIDTSVGTATHAQLLKTSISQLRQGYEALTRVRSIMNHNHDGAVFTDIEALFGLPATKGQTVFDLVNGAVGSMEGTFQVDDAKQITEQVG